MNTRYAALALLVVTAACDLTPVEIPIGEQSVVVHGVMRSDRDRQFIVVERSLIGDDSSLFYGGAIPTEGSPEVPIEGATVLVTNVDVPDDTCGSPVQFLEDIGDPLVEVTPGVYWASRGCPTLNPGDSLELFIETPDADTVTGAALVTAMESASLLALGETVPFGSDTIVTFNRDRDILRVRVEPIAGRLIQFELMRVGDLDMRFGEDLSPGAKLFIGTMDFAIPGNLVDAGGWSDGGDLFRAGRRYLMTVAVTDANYYDFSRSSSNKFTGRGFLNRLDGGFGVFGSLSSSALGLKVVGEIDDEREGSYWIRGNVQGVAIDVNLTVYLVRSSDETEVSALMTGDWIWLGPGPEGTTLWQTLPVEELPFEGTVAGDRFLIGALQPKTEGIRMGVGLMTLSGDRKGDASFIFAVADSMRIRSIPIGTLTATQQ